MKTKTKLNPVLQIDPEFESKIPPLTDEEYRQLEDNIVSEGVVLMPLIVWNNTIVDGHNRYKIVQAHPSVIFDVLEKDFENRFEALSWICKNQLGRRNLTPIQKSVLIGERYEAEKQAESFHGNQYTSSRESGGGQNDLHQKNKKTRQRIAEEAGVSEAAVKRYAQYSQGVAAAEEVSPGFRQEVLSGKVKPTQKEMQAIAKAAPDERKSLMEQIFHPRSGKASKGSLALIQKISDDMAKDKPRMTAQKAVQHFEWQVTRMLQSFDSAFDEWPQLIFDEIYRQQVIATLQDLKNYILQIEGGTRYEWDREARETV